MKILAVNGSPRITKSATYRILSALLEGMEEAGAETELVHLGKLKINHCLGCYNCWVQTPGECVQKDDMADLLPKMDAADLIVYGTPLYVFSMTGLMKNFLDRSIPRIEPWLVAEGDVTSHPSRSGKGSRVFLVSVCGFPEFEHFDPLVANFKHLARVGGSDYVGHILRPFAEPMAGDDLQPMFRAYYNLVRQAGGQIVRDGRIDEGLQAELRRDLFQMDKDSLHDMANAHWRVQMEKAASRRRKNGEDGTETDSEEETTVDLSKLSCRDMIAGMCIVFNREAAGDLHAVYYFKVTGDEPGDYALTIENGACSFSEGAPANPSLTIETPSSVWLGISRGELDGQQAFMSGQYKANGDFALLMRMNEFFGGN
jgi:putative NADPH-quinone reductase